MVIWVVIICKCVGGFDFGRVGVRELGLLIGGVEVY